MTYRLAGAKGIRALCLFVATAVAVALIGATASAAPAPIKIGGLFTEGASVGAPTTGSKTLKAFFRDYNARGGFKGRKIQVITANDGFSVEQNVALTKKLIDEGIVAFVGNESYLDCIANAGLYKQANVFAISYGGLPNCYAIKQVGAVSQSIQAQITLSAQYAKQNIGGSVCLIGYAQPGSDSIYKRAEDMLAKLKTKFAYKNVGLSPTADPTAALLEARSARCRTVVGQVGPQQGVQLMKAKQTQRIRNMDLILNQGHDPQTIQGGGSAGEGTYIFSYMYPFSNNDSRTKALRQFAKKHKITVDNFSTPVFAMSQLFVEALKRVKGSVTRQSVGAAISKLNVRNTLMPMPDQRFRFGGQGSGNAPNVAGYMVRIKKGKFVNAPKPQLVLPKSVRSLAGR